MTCSLIDSGTTEFFEFFIVCLLVLYAFSSMQGEIVIILRCLLESGAYSGLSVNGA